MIGVVTAAAVITQKIVERVRAAFPALDGYAVNLVAIGFGMLFSFGFGLALFAALGESAGVAPNQYVDQFLTGVAIGFGAGFVADIAGRSPGGGEGEGRLILQPVLIDEIDGEM